MAPIFLVVTHARTSRGNRQERPLGEDMEPSSAGGFLLFGGIAV